jgi:hypothetical protein
MTHAKQAKSTVITTGMDEESRVTRPCSLALLRFSTKGLRLSLPVSFCPVIFPFVFLPMLQKGSFLIRRETCRFGAERSPPVALPGGLSKGLTARERWHSLDDLLGRVVHFICEIEFIVLQC